ncbi:GNAT family N-acetyltransferase [Alsobacter sp. SYSU M60028]|uniref:GNAT family N-acetyltransferase n=1 Tax=Alsobacter ponti TaxID=2962936 RepID=A0ABT1LHM7_9HYPH|nr:GNAT family N-acetyltransferase [Alsobacter ponti]MCP8939738.1 GNAT family N-acetyltransferase [Alsobacter ponti]
MMAWRGMEARDLDAVLAVARIVHPSLPERREVFAERLALFPDGCRVLEGPGGLAGYLVSHPWRARQAPKLDTLLGALPPVEGTRYIHDLAIAPEARGQGAGERAVADVVADATRRGAPSLSLVSVYGSAPFWRRHGFAPADAPSLASMLASYGADAVFMERALRP